MVFYAGSIETSPMLYTNLPHVERYIVTQDTHVSVMWEQDVAPDAHEAMGRRIDPS